MRTGLALALLAVSAAPGAPARAGGLGLSLGDSIEDAINQTAACGDTITLAAGTYEESVNVWRECPAGERITVVGADGPRPVIDGGRDHAIRFSGTGIVFEHLELTTHERCDLDHRAAFGNGRDIDFVDLLIRDAGYDGLGTYCGAERIRLIDSEVARNGLACQDRDGNLLNGDGVDFFGCRDCEIAGSFIHGNNLYAVQIKGGAADVTVHDSVLLSRTEHVVIVGRPGSTDDCPGLSVNAERVTLRRNVLVSTDVNAWPLEVGEASDLLFEHNTVIVYAADPDISTDAGGFVKLESDLSGTLSAVIRNNIFDNRGFELLFPQCNAVDCAGAFTNAGFVAESNLFYDANGLDAASFGAASAVLGDPLFVDHPQDLSLSAMSPAIDVGVDVGKPYDGAAPDIGAFELGTSGLLPPDPMDPEPGSRGTVPRCACDVVGGRPAGPAPRSRWGLAGLLVFLASHRLRRPPAGFERHCQRARSSPD